MINTTQLLMYTVSVVINFERSNQHVTCSSIVLPMENVFIHLFVCLHGLEKFS